MTSNNQINRFAVQPKDLGSKKPEPIKRRLHGPGELQDLLTVRLEQVGDSATAEYDSVEDAERAMASIRAVIWRLGLAGQFRLYRVKDNPARVTVERISPKIAVAD